MFDLPRPCDNCPFLKEGGIRLHRLRAREIAGSQIENPGSTFPCHKTVPPALYDQMAEVGDDSFMDWVDGMQYCAGAIVFALKQDSANQALRIAGRMMAFRPELRSPKVQALVFDSIYEMECAQMPERGIPEGRSPNTGRKVKKGRGRTGRGGGGKS